MKTQAVRFHAPGAPEVLKLEELDLPEPAAGEVRIRHTAIGLNFQDIYARSGAYPFPLPSGLGTEAAGVVEAVGPGVTDFQVGERVCYISGPVLGACATHRNYPAARLLKSPAHMSDEQLAAMMLKAMTVEYLVQRCYQVKPGQFVLWHAAAGGVGLLAGQWGRHLGARMIGVAAGPQKCQLALDNGYEFCIDRLSEDHARAKTLAVHIAKIAGLTVDPPIDQIESNMVFFSLHEKYGDARDFCAKLHQSGVQMIPMGARRVRAVMHLDVPNDVIERAVNALIRVTST